MYITNKMIKLRYTFIGFLSILAMLAGGMLYGEKVIESVHAVSYSDVYSGSYSVARCNTYTAWRNSIDVTKTYNEIKFFGTVQPVGITCTGTGANTLCQGLLADGPDIPDFECDGGIWWGLGTCGAETGTELFAEAGGTGSGCSCGNDYDVRPCLANSNWGGLTPGDSCGDVAQTIQVVCVACSDSLIEGSEGCDDGDLDNGDGCDSTCQEEANWTCVGEPSVCTPDAICGDGVIEGGEVCDDSNTAAGDGCAADCTTIETGFVCNGQDPTTCGEYWLASSTGLDALWTLDESSGTLFDSVGTSSGTNNGASYLQTGIHGTAMGFNGTTNYISHTPPASLASLTSGSITAWVKIDVDDGAQHALFSISNDASATTTELFADTDMRAGIGQITVALRQDSVVQWIYRGGAVDSLNDFIGEYIHLAVVHDGVEVTSYINGTELSSFFFVDVLRTPWMKAILTDATTDSNTLSIGALRRNVATIIPYEGDIDDVMVWSKILSASEVDQIYNQGVLPTSSNFSTANGSTDFATVPEMSAISPMRLATSTDLYVEWVGTVNAIDDDFDANVTMGTGFITVDATALDTNNGGLNNIASSAATISIPVTDCGGIWKMYRSASIVTSLNELTTGDLIGSGTGVTGTCTDTNFCNVSPAPACSGGVMTYEAVGFSSHGGASQTSTG